MSATSVPQQALAGLTEAAHGMQLGTPLPEDQSPAHVTGKSGLLLDYAGPIATFVLFIGFWYLMSEWGLHAIFDKPQFLLTPPHKVVDVSLTNSFVRNDLWHALLLSTRVALLGLLLAIIIGMGLAIIMSQARWVEKSFWPYLVALQAIPILAFVPLMGVLFGYGINTRVIVCIIISLFPIVSNTLFGLLSADRGQHDLMTLHGATRWTRLSKLQLPAAMPSIFNGFRISAGLSVIGAIVGDTFFKQGDPGLGILIERYRTRLNYPAMYGAVVLSALLGIAVFVFFGWLGHRVVGHWHEATRKTG
jgi:NitT/TauT family transport system permease protein